MTWQKKTGHSTFIEKKFSTYLHIDNNYLTGKLNKDTQYKYIILQIMFQKSWTSPKTINAQEFENEILQKIDKMTKFLLLCWINRSNLSEQTYIKGVKNLYIQRENNNIFIEIDHNSGEKKEIFTMNINELKKNKLQSL
ncbi:MAG: hypothetical protein EOP34_02025 [Rickettsiales bacterium]|nr:MAG: hypothetical protein EOP34_02025 [Rickettsiales bacterium]